MRLPRPPTSFFRDFRRNQQGNIMVLFGLGFGVIAGVGALAVDMGNAYVLRGQLQRTADAAALAGASQLPIPGLAMLKAQEFADYNMPSAHHGTVLASADVVAGNWDVGSRTFTANTAPFNAVQVTTKRSQDNNNPAPTFFGRIFGIDSIDITASATAVEGEVTAPCLLALEPTDQKALDVGNRTLTANNCPIHVNSSHTGQAISGNPSGEIHADSICVNGAVSSGPSYFPNPDLGCPPTPDPLANFNAPAVGACNHTNFSITSGGDSM